MACRNVPTRPRATMFACASSVLIAFLAGAAAPVHADDARGRILVVPGVARLSLPAGISERPTLTIAQSTTPVPRLRAGERALPGVRIDGRAESSRSPSAAIEGQVSFTDLAGPGPFALVVRFHALGVPLEAYEPRAVSGPGSVTGPVPIPTMFTGAVEAFPVDLANSIEQVMAPVLMEDPLDNQPLGSRRVLVYVHGKDNADITGDHHDDSKIRIWHGLREHADYPSILKLYKPYFYLYPSYRSTRVNGADLVRLIGERLGDLSPDRVALVGHSMGGLVVRQAMDVAGFADKVAVAITASAPHHGALGGSLVYANSHISERLGPFWTLILRYGARGEPDTPGLRDLTWDNFDGSITPADAQRFGLPINTDLAAFNARWSHSDKLVCLMGDVSSLVGHETMFGLVDELYRRGQEAYSSHFGNCDPMVPFRSGTFEGSSVRGRVIFHNFDHDQIITTPAAAAAIFRVLKGEAITGD